jgi:hypothetical protein
LEGDLEEALRRVKALGEGLNHPGIVPVGVHERDATILHGPGIDHTRLWKAGS